MSVELYNIISEICKESKNALFTVQKITWKDIWVNYELIEHIYLETTLDKHQIGYMIAMIGVNPFIHNFREHIAQFI